MDSLKRKEWALEAEKRHRDWMEGLSISERELIHKHGLIVESMTRFTNIALADRTQNSIYPAWGTRRKRSKLIFLSELD